LLACPRPPFVSDTGDAMLTVAVFGYAVVGLSFLVLAALLATSWRGQRIGFMLISACLVSVLWAGVMAVQTMAVGIHPIVVYIAEVGRLFAWIGFLVYLSSKIGVATWLRALCVGVGGASLLAGPIGWIAFSRYGVAVTMTQVIVPSGLALSFCGLLLIEQLYRNTSVTARWGIKALSVGLGGMFAFELYYYSQAVLFSALDTVTWLARGWVNVLFVPAIAIAARRSPDWDLRIFVSRQVVFYTTTLFAVGMYFLVMSLGGFLLLKFGGSWGALARAIFFVGAAVVLAALLSSLTLRARFKVFLNKHFFQNKYDYREEWLRLVSTLADFDGGRNLGVAVQAIAQIVHSPSGTLWILDDTGERLNQEASWDSPDTLPAIDRSDSLVQFVERTGWVIDIEELRQQPDRYENLAVPGWLEARSEAWLLVPLIADQQLVGLVLLNKAPALNHLNYEDRDLLKTAGNHIAVHLTQARSEHLLSEARQFEAYNRLTAFLMHDLNNLIAQQSLIVSNADKHRRNPEFVDDAIATIAGSVERMKSVMEQLRRGRSEKSKKRTELKFLASRAVERCSHRKPEPELRLSDGELQVEVEASEFVAILTNLVKNAQEATDGNGQVRVVLERSDKQAAIRVEDSGSGMSDEFIRKRLFRPFDSTKGSQGMGIGVYHAREYMRRLGGDLQVSSELGKGTTMTLRIPLATEAGNA